MTPLISVLLALATTLFGFGLASLRGDLLKNAPNWAVPLIFATSGALYVLAVTLAVLHFRKERGSHVPAPFSRLVAATDDRPRFVLEVAGSQTIDSKLSDWKFLLTNCSTRTVTYTELGPLRSEIGAYEISFREVPVLTPGQKSAVDFEVVPRREDDRYSKKQATLWDFGKDHAGERGHTFIWYDIPIRYRDANNAVRKAGMVSVCFDLERKILKTEGVAYWNDRKKWRARALKTHSTKGGGCRLHFGQQGKFR